MTPQRVQRKRSRGWRMPEGAVYVGRPSRWGNPFAVEATPPRMGPPLYAVIERTASDSQTIYTTADRLGAHVFAVRHYELHTGPLGNYEWDDREEMLAPLRGKDLVCWCPPDLPCHADSLLRLANGWPDEDADD